MSAKLARAAERVIEAIEDLVSCGDTYKDKAQAVLDANLDARMESNLGEFLAWFQCDEMGDVVIAGD